MCACVRVHICVCVCVDVTRCAHIWTWGSEKGRCGRVYGSSKALITVISWKCFSLRHFHKHLKNIPRLLVLFKTSGNEFALSLIESSCGDPISNIYMDVGLTDHRIQFWPLYP